MTFKVVAEADAKRDWSDAVDWYETNDAGLGLRFDDALRAFLQTLSQTPDRFPFSTRLSRRARVPAPWPFTVYFLVNTKCHEVTVLAIWHGARDPEELRRRLK